MGQVKGKPSNPTPEPSPAVAGGGGGVRPPPQCTERQEAPLILQIVKEKEVEVRDDEGRTRDPPNEIRNRQKRNKLMRKNTESLERKK